MFFYPNNLNIHDILRYKQKWLTPVVQVCAYCPQWSDFINFISELMAPEVFCHQGANQLVYLISPVNPIPWIFGIKIIFITIIIVIMRLIIILLIKAIIMILKINPLLENSCNGISKYDLVDLVTVSLVIKYLLSHLWATQNYSGQCMYSAPKGWMRTLRCLRNLSHITITTDIVSQIHTQFTSHLNLLINTR